MAGQELPTVAGLERLTVVGQGRLRLWVADQGRLAEYIGKKVVERLTFIRSHFFVLTLGSTNRVRDFGPINRRQWFR